MAIAYTEASQSFMVDSRFKTTAFICFFTAILEIPSLMLFLFHMVANLKLSLNLMIFVRLPLSIVASVFSIYILLQLERLLVERYYLDSIRIMIKSLIIMYIISIAANIFFTLLQIFINGQSTTFRLLINMYGIPMLLMTGIIFFIYGVRLLELKDKSSGLYRIYAILQIIASVCFFTLFLFPIGNLLCSVAAIVLGMIFLKESETEPEAEFV
jgi:hypothetical protein